MPTVPTNARALPPAGEADQGRTPTSWLSRPVAPVTEVGRDVDGTDVDEAVDAHRRWAAPLEGPRSGRCATSVCLASSADPPYMLRV